MAAAQANPLEQLADIHAAAAPGLWPPAPGWWLLAALVLLVVLLLLRLAAKHHATVRRRKNWLKALATIGQQHDPRERPHDYLAALNRLFRAIALRAFPDTACARLEGSDWVAFLTGLMPEGEPVEALAALSRGPYEPAPEFDEQALQRLAASWVSRYG